MQPIMASLIISRHLGAGRGPRSVPSNTHVISGVSAANCCAVPALAPAQTGFGFRQASNILRLSTHWHTWARPHRRSVRTHAMFTSYTEGAIAVIVLAQQQARWLGYAEVRAVPSLEASPPGASFGAAPRVSHLTIAI
jgi:hypothetical protein